MEAYDFTNENFLCLETNEFDGANLLGTRSHGSVYKGILSYGMIVALKVFNLQLEGKFKSFEVQCEIMHNLRQRNLVKIISSCTNPDFKTLVMEYLPNGSGCTLMTFFWTCCKD
ncbi:Protein kinase domain [Dillenia turbinata]|uniref:Protein kinase domain n=1 Tax=Dillenia turbinata TaxID=194707 RepID=A0AAN8VS21_9MAGN